MPEALFTVFLSDSNDAKVWKSCRSRIMRQFSLAFSFRLVFSSVFLCFPRHLVCASKEQLSDFFEASSRKKIGVDTAENELLKSLEAIQFIFSFASRIPTLEPGGWGCPEWQCHPSFPGSWTYLRVKRSCLGQKGRIFFRRCVRAVTACSRASRLVQANWLCINSIGFPVYLFSHSI